MSLRKIIFWTHLVVGLAVGSVILTMAVTGIMIAYQRQMIAQAERSLSTVAVPADEVVALRPEALLAKMREAFPDTPPGGFTVRRDPAAAATVSFGRERTFFVNPYTGAVLGEVSKLRAFLHDVEHVHRDLALGQSGRWITGPCSLALLGMVWSGLFLWWPRPRSKAIVVPSLGLCGKARDFNWHNAVGLWSALPLMLAVVTGAIMSFSWANDLLFRLTGNEPPTPRAPRAQEAERPPPAFNAAGLDRVWQSAEQRVAGWRTISVRFPEKPGSPLNFLIDAGDGSRPDQRSLLTLNPKTGEVLKWEPFASYNLGRQLRQWTKPVHTGEALGLAEQTLAALAAGGATVLVWTGFALAWRRWRSRRRNGGADPRPSAPPAPKRSPAEATATF